jgi:hypothetical protein
LRDWAGVAVLCAALMLSFAAQLALAAGETHVFDPVLSLTGGCGTTGLDPVPDPGCPGGSHPPSGTFSEPVGITTDSHGDVYIASFGPPGTPGDKGRVDVFNSSGDFLTEFKDENGPLSLAVDSLGYLYVRENKTSALVRYTPSSYPPIAGTEYGTPMIIPGASDQEGKIAVDPSNDHLYVALRNHVAEYDSAANGNGLIDGTIGNGTLERNIGVAVNGKNHDVYASSTTGPFKDSSVIYVFDGEDPKHPLKQTINGSNILEGGFKSIFAQLAPAIEEANGHVFIGDIEGSHAVYEFDAAGKYVSTIEHSFQYVQPEQIAIDNGAESPNQGYLYVPSNPTGVGHLFAFEPKPEIGPPIVAEEAFSGVSTTEALLEAKVNPNGAAAHYRFEYVDNGTFEEDIANGGAGHGFDHAIKAPVPDATLPTGNEAIAVSQPIVGLAPGTTYHFRVVVSNECEEGEECTAEGEARTFATYPTPTPAGLCSNQQFRTGPSASPPDCRAYELITPPNTNGLPPTAGSFGSFGDGGFETYLASPDGNDIVFGIVGGTLPGFDGAAGFNGDGFEAVRGEGGWQTHIAGPSGAQAEHPAPGGVSPDHGYWFWTAGGRGSFVTNGHYIRAPDGSFELVGQGSLGADPFAFGEWITDGASHIIFITGAESQSVQLEPNAPFAGIQAIYDRTPSGLTHVVSLLPGEETPEGGPKEANAKYLGASDDGTAVAFKIGTVDSGKEDTRPLYVRIDNEKTLTVTESPDTTFAGISRDGSHVFYLRGRDIFAYDTASETTIPVGSGGESTVVNVSANGSHVYFVSPKQLVEGEGIAGKDNLYVWNGEAVRFIATLTSLDVSGERDPISNLVKVGGLGMWTEAVSAEAQTRAQGLAIDPSRTTPDGSVFVFESHADLTGYDPQGHSEVYRYDANSESLACLSCNPTLAPAASNAHLEILSVQDESSPTNAISRIANVTGDGRRIFFQTADALVPGDVDETQDVYEWEAEGVGSCETPTGCLHLISSGHSANPNYLYGMTPDGRDVFFRTTDLLVPRDKDGTPSIYDARVDGGFAEGEPVPCQGEACRGQLSTLPGLPTPASPASSRSGNIEQRHQRHRKHKKHRKLHHRKVHHKRGSSK